MIRIGPLMAANSRLTVCVNATAPCLQVGYRFQPLQPSISERNPLGISCPSTLTPRAKQKIASTGRSWPPICTAFYSNRLRAQTAGTFVSILKASVLSFPVFLFFSTFFSLQLAGKENQEENSPFCFLKQYVCPCTKTVSQRSLVIILIKWD